MAQTSLKITHNTHDPAKKTDQIGNCPKMKFHDFVLIVQIYGPTKFGKAAPKTVQKSQFGRISTVAALTEPGPGI